MVDQQEKPSSTIMEVIVMPYHSQGHMNTMLQFAKRLAFKGNGNIQITLATTLSTTQKMSAIINDFSFIRLATVYDDTTDDKTGLNFQVLMDKFKTEASVQLDHLIMSIRSSSSGGATKCMLVYDAHMEWALDVGKKCDVMTAAFFTQGCTYLACYFPMLLQEYPNTAAAVIGGGGVMVEPPLQIPLPTVEELLQELANNPYLSKSNSDNKSGEETSKKAPLHPLIKMVLLSMENCHLADWVLFNSFDHLEDEVVQWMKNLWNVRTVGPTLPSAYLDKRIEYDVNYGFSLYKPNDEACMNWLNTKQAASVVYIAFGSAASFSVDQMTEIAEALKQSPCSFLWVVRESEQTKLPKDFISETSDKGLVMSWCPQLDVLAHKAVGCFITHCGWNSTIEALSFGVPMLGMPRFMDQIVDAEVMDQVWGVGIRLKVNEKKLVSCEEIKCCLDEIMHGERAEKIKENAAKWKALAKEAVGEGGSTDRHIDEIIHQLASA